MAIDVLMKEVEAKTEHASACRDRYEVTQNDNRERLEQSRVNQAQEEPDFEVEADLTLTLTLTLTLIGGGCKPRSATATGCRRTSRPYPPGDWVIERLLVRTHSGLNLSLTGAPDPDPYYNR